MWVGRLNRADWSVDQGEVFVFPRDRKGRIVYGNVEGVVWLDDACTRVAVVSDRTKDDQPGRCREKEESVHIFDLPRPA